MCIFILNFKVISSLSLVALSSLNLVIVNSGIVKIFIVECSDYNNPDQYVERDVYYKSISQRFRPRTDS